MLAEEVKPVATLTQALYDKWLEAIPTYNKGAEALRDPDSGGGPSFCCLGVLADIIDPTKWSPYGWKYSEDETQDGLLVVEVTDAEEDTWESKYREHQDLYDDDFQVSFIAGLPKKMQDQLATINDSSVTWEPVIEFIKENVHPVPELL